MKPSFALSLSDDGIGLLHRTPRGWLPLGQAALDDPALPETLGFLRTTALGLEPNGFATALMLPNAQILYLTLDAPGPAPRLRRAQIETALDGRTPYGMADLVYDWSGTGPQVQVAVIARETLHEAEEFALAHRFNPISFIALPPEGAFDGTVFFGATRNAATALDKTEKLERDSQPLRILHATDPATALENGVLPAQPINDRSPRNEPARRAPDADRSDADAAPRGGTGAIGHDDERRTTADGDTGSGDTGPGDAAAHGVASNATASRAADGAVQTTTTRTADGSGPLLRGARYEPTDARARDGAAPSSSGAQIIETVGVTAATGFSEPAVRPVEPAGTAAQGTAAGRDGDQGPGTAAGNGAVRIANGLLAPGLPEIEATAHPDNGQAAPGARPSRQDAARDGSGADRGGRNGALRKQASGALRPMAAAAVEADTGTGFGNAASRGAPGPGSTLMADPKIKPVGSRAAVSADAASSEAGSSVADTGRADLIRQGPEGAGDANANSADTQPTDARSGQVPVLDPLHAAVLRFSPTSGGASAVTSGRLPGPGNDDGNRGSETRSGLMAAPGDASQRQPAPGPPMGEPGLRDAAPRKPAGVRALPAALPGDRPFQARPMPRGVPVAAPTKPHARFVPLKTRATAIPATAAMPGSAAPEVSPATDAASEMPPPRTAFGAKRVRAAAGQPRRLGVILTIGLVILLAAVAVWSVLFQSAEVSSRLQGRTPETATARAPLDAGSGGAGSDTADVTRAELDAAGRGAVTQVPAASGAAASGTEASEQTAVSGPTVQSAAAAQNPEDGLRGEAHPASADGVNAATTATARSPALPSRAAGAAPGETAAVGAAPPAATAAADPPPLIGGTPATEAATPAASQATGVSPTEGAPAAVAANGGAGRDGVAATATDLSQPALPAVATLSPDEPPARPVPPAPFGTTFARDDRGFVVATADGALTPEGARVFAGRPALTPPPRRDASAAVGATTDTGPADAALVPGAADGLVPGVAARVAPGVAADNIVATEPVTQPAVSTAGSPAQIRVPDPALAGFRPRQRPATIGAQAAQSPAPADVPEVLPEPATARSPSLVENGDGARLDGNLGPAAPSLLPRARPNVALAAAVLRDPAEDAAALQLAAASPQAVAASLRPNARPADRATAAARVPPKDFAAGVQQALAAAALPAPRPPAPAPTVTPPRVVAAVPPPVVVAPDVAESDAEPEVVSAAPAIPTRATVASAATITNAIALRDVNLIGVFGTSSNRQALVRLGNGRMQRVRVGDRVDGGQVAAIGADELRYVKNGRNVRLELPTDG